MTHDAARYPSPFDFDPERFLDAGGNLNQDTVGYAFGFGRRLVYIGLAEWALG